MGGRGTFLRKKKKQDLKKSIVKHDKHTFSPVESSDGKAQRGGPLDGWVPWMVSVDNNWTLKTWEPGDSIRAFFEMVK